MSVAVGIENSGMFYFAAHADSNQTAEFTYLDPFVLASVAPDAGSVDGGLTVQVNGSHFPRNVVFFCRFDDVIGGLNSSIAVTATWTSNEILRCVTPQHASGVVTLNIVSDSMERSGSALEFTYHDMPILHTVTPTRLMISGGSSIHLAGRHFRNTNLFVCRFVEMPSMGHKIGGAGMDFLVPAVWLSTTEAICTAPDSKQVVQMALSISNNASEFTDALLVRFDPLSTITSVDPSSGSVGGGASITVTGTNFPPTSLLSCIFGATACQQCGCAPPRLSVPHPCTAMVLSKCRSQQTA
jgi:hypothetical protein